MQKRDRGAALHEDLTPAQPGFEEYKNRDAIMVAILAQHADSIQNYLRDDARVTLIVDWPGHPEADAVTARVGMDLNDIKAIVDRSLERVSNANAS